MRRAACPGTCTASAAPRARALPGARSRSPRTATAACSRRRAPHAWNLLPRFFFFFFFSWRAPSVLSCGWRSEVVLVVGSGYLLVGCVRRHAPAPLQACMHFSKRGASAVDVDGLTRVRCLGRGPRRGGDQVGGWARSARAPCRGCMPRSGARAQVVKKTRAALVTRVIPAAAVAEWRGRIEAMADDVDRLVQARTAGPQGPRFKGQPRGFASDAEPSTRAVVCAWGGGSWRAHQARAATAPAGARPVRSQPHRLIPSASTPSSPCASATRWQAWASGAPPHCACALAGSLPGTCCVSRDRAAAAAWSVRRRRHRLATAQGPRASRGHCRLHD